MEKVDALVTTVEWPVELARQDKELLSILAEFGNHADDGYLQMAGCMAAEIFRQDRPGNFVILDDPDALLVRLVVSVTRKLNRQPRRILAPASTMFILGGWLKPEDGVSPVDGYLARDGNLSYWLGMIAFLHVGELTGSGQLASVFDLLFPQLLEDAFVLFNDSSLYKGKEAVEQIAASRKMPLTVCCGAGGANMLRKPWNPAPNPMIRRNLINDFNADDPLKVGIPTLMSANERFQLYYCARELVKFSKGVARFVEIGSFAGGTFFETAWAFERSGNDYQGIAVEPYGYPPFADVIKMFGDKAVHLKMNSHEAASLLASMFEEDKRPLLVLIDGDHRYEAVCQDIMDYYPLLAPGGVLIFHDFLPPAEELPRKYVESGFTSDNEDIRRACIELVEGQFGLKPIDLPLLYPGSLEQTILYKPIIPGVYSTIRAYRKPLPASGEI